MARVRQNARACGGQRLEFRRAIPDPVVLHQHHPRVVAGVPEPLCVGQTLADALTVDIAHHVDDSASRAERVGHDVPPETAVDEELRRGV